MAADRIAENRFQQIVEQLNFVYHDCPRDRLDWALSTQLVFYAKRAIEEPCPLRAWPFVPSTYLVCSDDFTASVTAPAKSRFQLLMAESSPVRRSDGVVFGVVLMWLRSAVS